MNTQTIAGSTGEPMNTHALRILITDDDEGDRVELKRTIKEAGFTFECTEAAGCDEAVSACEGQAYDLLMVDYSLPGANGLECISVLNKNFPLAPVIMLSGRGDESIATEAMKRGAMDYLSKSRLNAAAIQRAILNALEKTELKQKIKRQQNELELFARVLAHDLRAPAASIQTFSMRIGERLEEGDLKQALQYADWVNQTARRMNRLIETLHKYTTADAGIEFEPVDMDDVFASTLADLQNLIQAKSAVVTAAALPVVSGNASQLIQLLENLIANGIKYCDASQARIHFRAMEPAGSPKESKSIVFSVSDNGIGIPAADCKRVFQPFFRSANSHKRDGSGLGLATCRKIVERHGGQIWCESQPGAGTSFFFTLPAMIRGRGQPTSRNSGLHPPATGAANSESSDRADAAYTA